MNVDFPGSPGVVPKTEFGLPWGGFVDFLVIPKDSEGESWGLARNFKTSNGSLGMLPTSIRCRVWKLGFEGPNPTCAGFLVFSKDSERESWGLARNFKTSNGSLRMLPTSIRGRVWKLGFERPNPTCAGFLVVSKDPEWDFQVPPLEIFGIPWNIPRR